MAGKVFRITFDVVCTSTEDATRWAEWVATYERAARGVSVVAVQPPLGAK